MMIFRAVAAATLLLAAQPASADVDPLTLGHDYFVGFWAIDQAEACQQAAGAVVGIYKTGVWAVIDAGEAQVTLLGTWTLDKGGLRLTQHELGDPREIRNAFVRLESAEPDMMQANVEYEGSSDNNTLYRCSF